MTATFGKLQAGLELGDGLNIIEAPNETGIHLVRLFCSLFYMVSTAGSGTVLVLSRIKTALLPGQAPPCPAGWNTELGS